MRRVGVRHGVRLLAVSAIAAFLCASPVSADKLAGRVVGIIDGDTITLLTDAHKQVRVRLVEIDAPEKNQPWGQNSKKALSDMIFGQIVKMQTWGTDQYGRSLGKIYLGSKYINSEMVREGEAWAYREYLTDYSLISLETIARQHHVGLWSQPDKDLVPPWEWRHRGYAARISSPTDSADFVCGAKRYCRQMSSCAEARFYLKTCSVTSLDGDHDGVPCETLCR